MDRTLATNLSDVSKTSGYVASCTPLENCIRNVKTALSIWPVGEYDLPLTVNSAERERGNCYVVSPMSTYIDYALYELNLLHPYIAFPLRLLIQILDLLLQRSCLNRVVFVNNWLLSTNLYPVQPSLNELELCTTRIQQHWPQHAIGFRSLNDFSNPDWLAALHALGYIAVPSRQVYLFDGRQGAYSSYLQQKNVKFDQKLLKKTHYRVIKGESLTIDMFARFEQLYNLLYLDKYCTLNPQFTAAWLYRGHTEGWLELSALLAPDGSIDGVVGWMRQFGMMTVPIVGYDTAKSQKDGLYRLLTVLCLQEAAHQRIVLNFSSGAAHFKRLRGAQAHIEYTMVCVRHLTFYQQVGWRVLSFLLRHIAVPIMKRFKL